MANLAVKDGAAATKYLKATGAGTDLDPFVVERKDTNSAAMLAALQAIQVAVELLDNAIAGAELQADIVSSALPAGAATAANQTTLIGHVDGIEALLGTIDADTSALAAALPLTDTQLRASVVPVSLASTTITSISAGDNNIGNVDIASALPAGTNAIGKLAANSGVDIGDVDVTSLPALVASEAHVGKISGSNIVVRVTHSTDTGAYHANDLLADVQAVAGAARVNAGTTELRSVTLIDVEEQNAALDIVFTLDNTSLGTENSAPNMSDANGKLKILGIVSVAASDWKDCGGFSVATPAIAPLLMQADAGTTSIYVGLITRGTPTHAGGEIVGVYSFVRD